MRRITESDASLAEKLLSRIKSLKNAFAGSKDPSVRAQSTRLSKAEKLWLKAVDDAGYKYAAGKIVKMLEEEKERQDEDVTRMNAEKVQVAENEVDNEAESEYNGGAQFSIDVSKNVGLKELDSNGDPIYDMERHVVEPTDFKLLRQRIDDAAVRYQLSNKQRISLEAYVMGLAYFGNKKVLDNKSNERDMEYMQTIVDAVNKFPTFHGRTYRNLKFRTETDYNAFLAEHALGSTVLLKAITSMSERPNGYPLYGKYVVHLVIDGQSGRDIADTFGIPKQQEVLFVPGASYTVRKITIANDGNPMIFVKEIANNEVQVSEGYFDRRHLEYDRNVRENRGLSQQKRDDMGRVLLRDGRRDENTGGRVGEALRESDNLSDNNTDSKFSLSSKQESDGARAKANANRHHSKTYTRAEAAAIMNAVAEGATDAEGNPIRIKGQKGKLIDAFWERLNEVDENSGERMKCPARTLNLNLRPL